MWAFVQLLYWYSSCITVNRSSTVISWHTRTTEVCVHIKQIRL